MLFNKAELSRAIRINETSVLATTYGLAKTRLRVTQFSVARNVLPCQRSVHVT